MEETNNNPAPSTSQFNPEQNMHVAVNTLQNVNQAYNQNEESIIFTNSHVSLENYDEQNKTISIEIDSKLASENVSSQNDANKQIKSEASSEKKSHDKS